MTTVNAAVAAGHAQLAEPIPEMAAKTIGVAHRIQRKGVLRRAGDAVEVRLRPRRDHQVIGGAEDAGIRRDGLRVQVDRDDLTGDDGDLLPALEHLLERTGDVVRRELRRRDLVEQRLELGVVVTVDEGHLDAVTGQLSSARRARHSSTDDDDAHPPTVPQIGLSRGRRARPKEVVGKNPDAMPPPLGRSMHRRITAGHCRASRPRDTVCGMRKEGVRHGFEFRCGCDSSRDSNFLRAAGLAARGGRLVEHHC